MRLSPLIPFVSLSLSVLAAAAATLRYRVHEKRSEVPHGWGLRRRLDASTVLPFRIALKQKNIENIATYLYDVSHPKSPNYGQHWSPGDVARVFAPADESIDTVRGWLASNGIEEDRVTLSSSKGWLHADVTIEEVERLIKAEYYVYTHASGKEHVACEEYHLPEHVQQHVYFVTPSVNFDARLSRRSGGTRTPAPVLVSGLQVVGEVTGTVSGLGGCDTYITPDCLRALYGLHYSPIATNNSLGIVEYMPNSYLDSDLQAFAQNFSTDLIGKRPVLVSIDGGQLQTVNSSFADTAESDLDLQYAMALVTGAQPVTLYQVGDMIVNNSPSLNNFLDAIDGSYCSFEGGDDPILDAAYPDPAPGGYNGPEACGTVKPSYVISTSYGYNEADLPPFYAERQCTEYAKLGLMGVTILYSSGDYGVAGNYEDCSEPDGTRSPSGRIFNPTFPSTCPYVTSVGATMMRPNSTVHDPEVACTEFSSAGGFSNYFALPDYQKGAVGSYLENYSPDYPPSIWNSTGRSRGFPDISANGANYVAAIDGTFQSVYGTSCSAPVSAAIFTMINDARLAAGKGPIGFINPTVYSAQFAGAFNDITEGSNPGCGTAGFNATVGWDPVTGLGTPNFPALRSLWLALP